MAKGKAPLRPALARKAGVPAKMRVTSAKTKTVKRPGVRRGK